MTDKQFEECCVPAWKKPWLEHQRALREDFLKSSVGDVFKKCANRFSYLSDTDNQLHKLLNYFDDIGIPMGSEQWAEHAIAHIAKLEEDSRVAYSALHNEDNPYRLANLRTELKAGLKHSQEIYSKRRPKEAHKCDVCGWPDARYVEDSNYYICTDCYPDEEEEESSAFTLTKAKFTQHIPNYCSGFEPVVIEFYTQEELLSHEAFQKIVEQEDFSHFAMSDDRIVEVKDGGYKWWVLGKVSDARRMTLPKWIPLYKDKNEQVSV